MPPDESRLMLSWLRRGRCWRCSCPSLGSCRSRRSGTHRRSLNQWSAACSLGKLRTLTPFRRASTWMYCWESLSSSESPVSAILRFDSPSSLKYSGRPIFKVEQYGLPEYFKELARQRNSAFRLAELFEVLRESVLLDFEYRPRSMNRYEDLR